MLMQIKEMRNRRAHIVSRKLFILAREAYKIADHSCYFFEMMTVEVPADTHSSLKVLRQEALKLLYEEEFPTE